MEDDDENFDWEVKTRGGFSNIFKKILSTIQIPNKKKLIIKERYIGLYRKYSKNYLRTSLLYNNSRIIITLGSILVPALLTLDDELSERSLVSQSIYYTTFSLSLLVTLTNAISELFQINKKYFAYAIVKENITSEAIQFLALSGKYRNYNEHIMCYRKFIERIEKLNHGLNNSLTINSAKDADAAENHKIIDLESQSGISEDISTVFARN